MFSKLNLISRKHIFVNRIVKKMSEIIDRDVKTKREVWKRDKAISHFKKIGEEYKAEIIESIPKNEAEANKIISEVFELLTLSINKAEKDIGIYKSSISKMEQAKELIEELRIKDKKKNQ